MSQRPIEALSRVLSPIVHLNLAPTRANAMSILRSPAWSSKLVGRTLGLQLSRGIMSEIGEVPVPMPGKDDVMEGLKSEVLDHLWQEHGPRDDDDAECHRVRTQSAARCREPFGDAEGKDSAVPLDPFEPNPTHAGWTDPSGCKGPDC